MAGDKDDRDLDVGRGQVTLQFETAHVRQPHIQHQARRRLRPLAAEKLAGRAEGFDPEADRAMSLLTASRTDASSSTTKTIGSESCMRSFTAGRQCELKRRAVVAVVVRPQTAAVSLDDGMADG